MNRTFGGSKDIKDTNRAAPNNMRCGTFCLIFKSLKLKYAMLLTIKIERDNNNDNVKYK